MELKSVGVVTSRRVRGGKEAMEVRYYISSLDVGVPRLARSVRGFWGIENGLHYVREVSPGEDACRVRSGSSPQILGALRNVVLRLARQVGKGVAAVTHHWYLYPFKAIQLLDRPD
jgi:predicted transposase YbfD/YdcC